MANDYDFIDRFADRYPIVALSRPLLKAPRFEKTLNAHGPQEIRFAFDHIRLRNLKRFGLRDSHYAICSYLRLLSGEYLEDHELEVVIEWLNAMLRKNEQLRIYDSDVLYRFFKNVILVAYRKNRLGGWSIERSLLAFIEEKLPAGSTILEFGSGFGTEALLRKYQVISLEHDVKYALVRGERHICLQSSLQNGWYHRKDVINGLAGRPDLVLIDGPPGDLRQGVLNNLDLFESLEVPVIFDDIDRDLDWQTMLMFCKKLRYSYEVNVGAKKKFAYCTRLSVNI